MTDNSINDALARLFEIAKADTGQSRRVADFLLAWWNAADHGGFDIAEMFSLDVAVADDIAAVVTYLGRRGGAIYADAFGHRSDVEALIKLWRSDRRRGGSR